MILSSYSIYDILKKEENKSILELQLEYSSGTVGYPTSF